MSDDASSAPGGFCAPVSPSHDLKREIPSDDILPRTRDREAIIDVDVIQPVPMMDLIPPVTVPRGGIVFPIAEEPLDAVPARRRITRRLHQAVRA